MGFIDTNDTSRHASHGTRSPAGHTKSVVPTDDGYGRLRKVANAVGKVPPPTTNDIVNELKLSIGQALLGLRAMVDPEKQARAISLLSGAISKLVTIGKLEEMDIRKMSMDDLKREAEKLIAAIN